MGGLSWRAGTARHGRRLGPTLGLVGLGACIAGGTAADELSVGVGSSVDLGSGAIDLGCSDLTVAGRLSAGSIGVSGARDVTIGPAGVLEGRSATLEVTGDWDNAGTFDAGTSRVHLGDGCERSSAVVSGDTTFADLAVATATGKVFRFAAGSSQTVTGALRLLGAQAELLTIRSTSDGSEASLEVRGSGSGDFVDVRDSDASGGNPIALGPNSVKGPNTPGWVVAPWVPALGVSGLAALALALWWSARRALVRRRRPPGDATNHPLS